jgi:4-hydroxy-tetrahydrodipicolinate synthase
MNTTRREFIPVMLTPFKDNGEVDFKALTELTEYYIKAGATGLFANCLSSEMYELTEQERLQVVKHVVDVAGGGVSVVATGTFGGEISKQADFVKKIHDTGVDAVIVITSLLAGQEESDEIFAANTFKLLEQTDQIPLGFYECPVPYKRIISPALLKTFIDTDRIIYHKDTCLDIQQVTEKIEAGKGHKFGLYDAYMGHAVASLKAGAAGLSCIQGNYWPDLIVWLCDNFNNPALAEEVEKVQQFHIDNMDVMHNVYPITSKYFLQKRGLSLSAFTRKQGGTVALTNEVKKDIDQLYAGFDQLAEELELSQKA